MQTIKIECCVWREVAVAAGRSQYGICVVELQDSDIASLSDAGRQELAVAQQVGDGLRVLRLDGYAEILNVKDATTSSCCEAIERRAAERQQAEAQKAERRTAEQAARDQEAMAVMARAPHERPTEMQWVTEQKGKAVLDSCAPYSSSTVKIEVPSVPYISGASDMSPEVAAEFELCCATIRAERQQMADAVLPEVLRLVEQKKAAEAAKWEADASRPARLAALYRQVPTGSQDPRLASCTEQYPLGCIPVDEVITALRDHYLPVDVCPPYQKLTRKDAPTCRFASDDYEEFDEPPPPPDPSYGSDLVALHEIDLTVEEYSAIEVARQRLDAQGLDGQGAALKQHRAVCGCKNSRCDATRCRYGLVVTRDLGDGVVVTREYGV